MITLIKPILFAFFKSDAVKKLLVDILEKLAKETDNDLDDTAVAAVRIALLLAKSVHLAACLKWNGLIGEIPCSHRGVAYYTTA